MGHFTNSDWKIENIFNIFKIILVDVFKCKYPLGAVLLVVCKIIDQDKKCVVK